MYQNNDDFTIISFYFFILSNGAVGFVYLLVILFNPEVHQSISINHHPSINQVQNAIDIQASDIQSYEEVLLFFYVKNHQNTLAVLQNKAETEISPLN